MLKWNVSRILHKKERNKNMKKLIAIMLALVFAFALFACEDTSDNGKENEPAKLTVETMSDLKGYKIVRPDICTDEEKELVTQFHQTLYNTFKSLQIATDFKTYDKEILIGNTNRPETKELSEGLRYDDYVIKKIGEKLIIVGGSTDALKAAIEFFTTNLVDTTGKSIKAPTGNGYVYKETYPLDKLTVDGVDISEMTLYNASLEDTDELAARFRRLAGTNIPTASEPSTEKCIIVDGTGFDVDKYSITVDGGNLVIKGSAHSLTEALRFFFENTIAVKDSRELHLTSEHNIEGSIGEKEIYSTDDLKTVLRQVNDDMNSVIIGEEVQGHNKPHTIADKISHFEELTGQKPGIIGIDLACYGIDLMESTDVQWSSFICDLVDYAAGGGIITASAHWENPSGNTQDSARVRGLLGYDDTMEGYEKAFTDLITEGTEYNTFFKNELDADARFLKALGDNGVSIIWRPLHEANGSWFWFCTTQNGKTLDASYLINVWRYVYEYYTDELGLNNLVWCYGPNLSTNIEDNHGSTMSASYLYPGDEYCDMVGVDWYTGGELEPMNKDNYVLFTEMAGKPSAITEFGPPSYSGDKTINDKEVKEKYSCDRLYGDLVEMLREDYNITYLLTWGDGYGVELMGKGKEFMDRDITLGQADVKALFDALK